MDDQWRQRIPTPLINRTLKDIIDQRQPPNKTGKRFKLYYAVQLEVLRPPLPFVNAPHVAVISTSCMSPASFAVRLALKDARFGCL